MLLILLKSSNEEKGIIDLKSYIDDNKYIVLITDNGVGLKHEKDEILKPYFTTRKKSGGTGLGLSIVEKILFDHNAEFEIINRSDGVSGAEVKLFSINKDMKNILIIDDEKDILKSVNAILTEEGYKCYEALNSSDALNIYNTYKIDLILLDVWLEDSDHDGIKILEIIRAENNVPIILMSGHGNIDMAVNAIKKGAQEFVEKPFSSERLLLSVNRTLEITQITEENVNLKNKEIFDYEFIGTSQSISKIKQLIDKVAPTSSRVLIQGESGTGKDVVAKEIHLNSKNSDGPFVVVNAALLSPDNIEIELLDRKTLMQQEKGYLKNRKMALYLLMKLVKCHYKLKLKY